MKNTKMTKGRIALIVLFAVLILGSVALFITAFIINDWNLFPILMPIGSFVFVFSLFGLFVCLMPFIYHKMAKMTAPVTKEYMKEVGIPTKEDFCKTEITCPYCGKQNPASAGFCSSCGRKLETICPKCGYHNKADAKYCNQCGEKLD